MTDSSPPTATNTPTAATTITDDIPSNTTANESFPRVDANNSTTPQIASGGDSASDSTTTTTTHDKSQSNKSTTQKSIHRRTTKKRPNTMIFTSKNLGASRIKQQNTSASSSTKASEADKMAKLLQKQLKKRKYQSNDAEFDQEDGHRNGSSSGSKFHHQRGSDSPARKRQKRNPRAPKPQFIVPDLPEEALQKYHERRRKNFPSREKLRLETEERWRRIERGEVVWEDYSRNQWQLNKDENASNTTTTTTNTTSRKEQHKFSKRPHHKSHHNNTPSRNQMTDEEKLLQEEEHVNSLLDHIVKSDQDREINVILQAFRFFVHHRFFLNDQELNTGIAKELDELHSRTQREIVTLKESLKRKYPREQDKMTDDDEEDEEAKATTQQQSSGEDDAKESAPSSSQDEDDSSSLAQETDEEANDQDLSEDDESDIEEKALNLSDSELEHLAHKEAQSQKKAAASAKSHSRGGHRGRGRGRGRGGRGRRGHRGRGRGKPRHA